MAHFAQLDDNNIVQQVIVLDNAYEARGAEFIANDLGLPGRWLQTSYNGNIRKNYAGIGYTYDEDLDAFIPPKPFDSWVLNAETARWDAPTPYPTDGEFYVWDEETLDWKAVDNA